jgi:hypothetical protein
VFGVNQQEAEQALLAWASIERDELVRAAHEAGVSKNRIHTLTGIARTTIDRILEPSMLQIQTDRLAAYLARFTDDWPRQGYPLYFVQSPAMASTYTAQQIADRLFADAEFKALRLGTFLNTPDGRLLVAAVEALAPPPYQEDIALLVEALQLAAKMQHEAARETFLKGVFAVGLGALVVAAVANGNS